MNWAAERRLDFIEDQLVRRRRINRADLERFFGVSTPKASQDINAYLALNSNVQYDKREKTYVPTAGFMPVRHSSADRRNAWAVWDPDRPLDANRCDCDACRGADRQESWGEAWQLRLLESAKAS